MGKQSMFTFRRFHGTDELNIIIDGALVTDSQDPSSRAAAEATLLAFRKSSQPTPACQYILGLAFCPNLELEFWCWLIAISDICGVQLLKIRLPRLLIFVQNTRKWPQQGFKQQLQCRKLLSGSGPYSQQTRGATCERNFYLSHEMSFYIIIIILLPL